MPKAEEPSRRRTQPQCKRCHHTLSFHGRGQTDCKVVGCECEGWAGKRRIRKPKATLAA